MPSELEPIKVCQKTPTQSHVRGQMMKLRWYVCVVGGIDVLYVAVHMS